MFYPAARKRRMRQRQMAQATRNAGRFGSQQMNQQENGNGFLGWTWWQQLIGVELLIGGFIISWYVITFCYQVGFKNYLVIPLYYMDFSLFTLLKPGLNLLIVLFYLIILFVWFFTKDRLMKYVFWIVFPFFAVITNFDITGKSTLFLFIVPLCLATILIRRANRLGRYDKKAEELQESPVSIALFIIIVLVFACVSSMSNGLIVARNQERFYIIDDHKEIKVVLDTYKDYYITAPVNIKKKTFKPEFELIPIYKDDKEPPVQVVKDSKELNQAEKQEEKIVLKYMEIGPLRPDNPYKP
ncbi:hypothetical protein [Laceyella tengchongensis]|uniref:hypothetical protein n=1 Tax=Laceyella tengchongensis TaxID=574699 RepID=UPI0012B7CD31|nr:hypothetical protein [Laceyella tengchongensis]